MWTVFEKTLRGLFFVTSIKSPSRLNLSLYLPSHALNPGSALEEQIHNYLRKGKTKEAFEAIVAAYSERLYWHIRRMLHYHADADDVLQNTYIKIWKNLHSFRGDAKIYTWLYRIATNEALAHMRSRKNLQLVGSVEAPPEYLHLRADVYFDGESAVAKLAEAVALLPDKQRAVFNLKYFEEMKYEEMSEVLETSVGALKASYHHAVKKIRDFLEED